MPDVYKNISQCVTPSKIIENATVVVDQGKIKWLGETSQMPDDYLKSFTDCKGEVWFPGLVECHTHLIYGGHRHHDFAKRSTGKTYAEVAKEGGGILSTVEATRKASAAELLVRAEGHLALFEIQGVAALEIKSGYGLTLESEIKMLEVVKTLQEKTSIKLISTFLPAHAVPPEFKNKKSDFVTEICKNWIPEIAKQKLATFFDVFIEEGYFNSDEARKMCEVAIEHGLKIKLHVDQFTDQGGVELGVELKATSVDHLDHISKSNIKKLAASETVAVLLPGASLFTRTPYPPARELIDAGATVALSTDFNPGTCPSHNLPLQMTIACTQMGMTVPEAINAVTLNAAKALGIENELGSIEVGKTFSVFKAKIPSFEYLPYSFGDIYSL